MVKSEVMWGAANWKEGASKQAKGAERERVVQ